MERMVRRAGERRARTGGGRFGTGGGLALENIENDLGIRHRSIKRASREQSSARQLRGVRIRGVIREILV